MIWYAQPHRIHSYQFCLTRSCDCFCRYAFAFIRSVESFLHILAHFVFVTFFFKLPLWHRTWIGTSLCTRIQSFHVAHYRWWWWWRWWYSHRKLSVYFISVCIFFFFEFTKWCFWFTTFCLYSFAFAYIFRLSQSMVLRKILFPIFGHCAGPKLKSKCLIAAFIFVCDFIGLALE